MCESVASGLDWFRGSDARAAAEKMSDEPEAYSHSRLVTSKDKFKRTLQNSRVSRRSDLSKRTVGQGCIRIVELRVVQEVEELRAELQIDPLGQREHLMGREIDIESAGTNQDVSAGVAECIR